jgi:hypothetical protein
MGAQAAEMEIIGERCPRKTQSSALTVPLATSRPLDGWLLVDGVALRAALGLGCTVANGPERGACGGVSVRDDLVH